MGIDAVDLAGQIDDTLFRTEQSSTAIAYQGAWTQSANASRSAGEWVATNSEDTAAFISFSGRRIDLVGSKAPNYGIAKITVDGGTPQFADYYASGYKHQQKIWSISGLADGAHTVVIEWSGTKNAASTGTAIGVDALDVAGSLTQASVPGPSTTRTEEASPLLAYSGAWTGNANTARSAGAWLYTDSAGAAAHVSFSGTYLSLVGSKAPNYGIAKITVDGGTPQFADYYASGYKHQQKIWSISGLADGAHTVVIEWSGTKNAASTGTAIGVDALDVAGSLTQASVPGPSTTRTEEASPLLAYSGAWTGNANTARSAGAWLYTDSAGAAAHVNFSGTYLSLVGSKAPNYGIAKITVDGGTPQFADYYASGYKHQQKIWSISGLADGAHTVVIEWSGTKNAASTGTAIGVDALDVAGSLTQAP